MFLARISKNIVKTLLFIDRNITFSDLHLKKKNDNVKYRIMHYSSIVNL